MLSQAQEFGLFVIRLFSSWEGGSGHETISNLPGLFLLAHFLVLHRKENCIKMLEPKKEGK